MIDLKYIRENAEKVKTAIVNKNEPDRVDEILQLDKERRNLIQQTEELKAKKNKVSQEVGKLKREKKDAEDLIKEMKQVADEIKELDDKLKEVQEELDNIMLTIPNLPHESVPVGKSESDNVEVRKWLPDGFSLDDEVEALDHVELGKRLDILDFERAAKITGSSFPLYRGKGATLERALINFMIDYHIEKHGYTEVLPPFFANRESMQGTGQLPKMEDDMYHITREDLFPIPTAEVPVTNIYRDDMLSEDELPVKFCAYSPCFRREAGSYGKETKGFLRVHQFNKVEMVKFVKPGTSYDELELLLNDAEEILRELGIPYRILELCTGDLSFAAAKCYDIETWSPAEKKWLEASSCSNFENFQAKRANIRYRKKEDNKPEYLHTLNGSGLATSRLMVSLLEHYQTPEGKITVPKALHKYTGFTTIG